ncbi:hypothetical protein H112_07984 [Trichophyton rubrum D6]|uniref:Uncharacterized protein n=5 Tax=Trichophyton TaxID=5550 RepID=A0A178ETF7_TRIRU|nr:uncharacterized protein TERG_00573 [Trichophyton rubrum CBS 118892]EZF10775.1 hypothetical protein H100_08012 [Trichophyton rubrum MR850]EZF37672.1 hypothetical protein H102_07972 [Trichophyton rubrum CBS 100081]EZF48351.1 hypothetical protein H103_07996 [Trichophyton rubrum CBS 288.86]EZF58941.1 hypothetical protein H104_07943 [Trichophyton rubrum CBS 289.86]EZF69540.1 hypothetical protein H105_07996 [Trichophyton soudanense CBS 452.61]EZF80229.1 hypothetical protein H110_07995 [Trichophy
MANQTLQSKDQMGFSVQPEHQKHLQQHQQPLATTLSQTAVFTSQSTSASSQTNSLQRLRLYQAGTQTDAEMQSQIQTQHASDQQIHLQGQSQQQEMCGKTATAQFLQNVNLVAEAARRAQMGILMRDFEEITFD